MQTVLDSPDLYTIGWLAALPIERAAAVALLDEVHGTPNGFQQPGTDPNAYTWGKIHDHNIVIASLPAGKTGLVPAAFTASALLHAFPQIRIGLLVGIAGGIARPDKGKDIRLGDVVVSQPNGTTGGVIQYDYGKAKANNKWERKGSLNSPPLVLLHALATIQAAHETDPSQVPDLLEAMWTAKPLMKKPKKRIPGYVHQGSENDRLFASTYDHIAWETDCNNCEVEQEVKRIQRESTDPEIHYGVIASGNAVLKDATARDELVDIVGNECLCVEMEAAGLMDQFPCLVIRGVCDYADSHKNDQWQRYASATAAAYAKELLSYIPIQKIHGMNRAIDLLQSG